MDETAEYVFFVTLLFHLSTYFHLLIFTKDQVGIISKQYHCLK
jgi:hypothetical protein